MLICSDIWKLCLCTRFSYYTEGNFQTFKAKGDRTKKKKKKKKKRQKGKGTWPATHAPRQWDTTPGKDVVNQHTHPKKRRETEGRKDDEEDGEKKKKKEERRRRRRRRRRRSRGRRRKATAACVTNSIQTFHKQIVISKWFYPSHRPCTCLSSHFWIHATLARNQRMYAWESRGKKQRPREEGEKK